MSDVVNIKVYENTPQGMQEAVAAAEARLDKKIDDALLDSQVISGVTTSSPISASGNIHAIGIGPGTYPNWGGMIIPAENIGTLQRVSGVYSVSLTPILLSSKVNVADVINTLTSSETTKPLSAAQGKLLNDVLFKFETIWTEGFYIAPDGNSYGESGFRRTDFLNVLAGRTYSSNYGHNLAFYDIDKLFISYVNSAVVTIPATCVYVRFSTALAINDVRFNDNVSLFANLANKNVVNAIDNKLKKLNNYITWSDGFYQVPDGTVYTDASFTISDLFLVSENTVYNMSNVHRILFFKEDKTVISENTVTANKTTSPALAYYCRISQTIANKSTTYFYNVDNNFYNLVLRKEFEGVNASNKRIAKTVNYDTVSKLDSLASLDKVKATVVGTVGAEGAIYTIPLQSRGGEYRLSFDLKLPRDLNTGDTESVINIASIPFNIGNANCTGRFDLKIKKLKPSVQLPFAQPKFNSGIVFYPTYAVNNYKVNYFPDYSHKQFVGDDSFSIRYKGDISLAINQDICLTVSDTGILIYHSTNNSVIISEPFPASKSLNEFVTTLITKTNVGGVYFSEIEFNHYSVDDKSTDDLIRFAAVPLVANYDSQVAGKGYNAFPCFVPLFDESYHKIEIIYNNLESKIHLYIDGYRCYYVDGSFGFEGTGAFDANITIGAAGCVVRDFKFENFVAKTIKPRIIMYMSHFLIDGVRNVSNGAGISLGRLNEIINKNKEIGSYFVDLEQIENYIYGRGTLPEKCWSIIHDDLDYLSNATDLLVKKFRNLYSKHAIKPAFALIMTNNSDTKKNQILLDRDIYNFHLHDVDHTKALHHRTYIDCINAIAGGLLTFRNWLFSTRYYTYPYGGFDINVLKLMEHNGVSLAFAVGSSDGNGQSMCARYHNCAQPRSGVDGGVGSVILPSL